jgi:hypothetical protein
MLDMKATPAETTLVDSDNVVPEAGEDFVTTRAVDAVTKRALAYLQAGYPVHLAGPAGTGKTTIAFHLAALWGQPVTLLHGNDEFSVSDLVGTNDAGYRRSKVVDNYIHSVMRTEEEMRQIWVDNRLTTACRNGDTLIYDEFNRSRPEANNVLLSVLSEGILNLPGLRTIRLNPPDRDTELAIVKAKSGLDEREAGYVVDIVRELRGSGENKTQPTLRAGIAMGRILSMMNGRARFGDTFFHHLCYDALGAETAKIKHAGKSVFHDLVDGVIKKVCPPSGAAPGQRPAAAGKKKPTLVDASRLSKPARQAVG